MNVKRLKEIIQDLPDDMEVVTSSFDHSYRPVGRVQVVTAELHAGRSRQYSEYYDDANMSGGTKVQVLWTE